MPRKFVKPAGAPRQGARAVKVVEDLRTAAPAAPIADAVEFKLYDESAALGQIAKHLGLYAPT